MSTTEQLPLKTFAPGTMQMAAKEWIAGDETAAEMLGRVAAEQPFSLLPPPLHRVPLRVGNVVELAGPTSSAKTHILIQAAVNCILPKEWHGVHYGGLERLVMFLDLDCRFDILRLSEMLKHRIMEHNGSLHYDEELYSFCMRRFLYVRCYDSSEFLATLKTLHYRLQKEKEVHHTSIQLLMIDSIGAFHWIDRGSTFFPLGGNKRRKCLSFQSVSDTVVQEIKKLLMVHPMVVMATKEIILGNAYGGDEVKQNRSLRDDSDLRNLASITHQLPYREYMPSSWQSFITHKILVRASDDHPVKHSEEHLLYLSEWLLPSLCLRDKFIVKTAGIVIVS